MSKIKLIKNNDIHLDIPHFSCDKNAVGEHLNDHPLTALLNNYGFTVFIGRPGQGKTSMVTAFITQSKPRIYKKTHHNIIIMMPQYSIRSMEKNPFVQLPPENFYNELTEDTIVEVYSRIEANVSQNKKTLLLIDDMTASLKSSTFIVKLLKMLVFNRRHLKTNIIITSQSYNNIPLDLRKCISNLFMFKPSKKEMELLFEELIETKKDNFMDIMRHAFGKSHNFLFVNIESQRLFCNWNEIIIDNDDEMEDKTKQKIL